MSSPANEFYLPDLFKVCPLEGSSNPHYKSAGAESAAWINSHNIFTDQKRAFFVQGCNELLVSRCYPYAGYDEFRVCCDFVNLLFVVDEVSDDQTGCGARMTGQVFLNAMHDPEWHDGSALASMTREFRARFHRLAGPLCFTRFLKHCDDYIEAVSKEAEYREREQVLGSSAFVDLRRENSAIRLCFGLFEAVLGVEIPDFVFENPAFMSMYWAAADMVCWSNDVYSYKMECAKGHSGNNIVTVLMNETHQTLQETSNAIGRHFAHLMRSFVSAKADLPAWGPDVDPAVESYVEAMQHWVIGNLMWSFETKRYFGPEHDEIRRTRLVRLRT